jgi:predicted RNA-binding Zn ribbon-like protein
VIPETVIALANLERRRRGDTEPRAPLTQVVLARRALAEAGLSVDGLTDRDLPALTRLVRAVSALGNSLALQHELPSSAVEVINKLASGCKATTKLAVQDKAPRTDVDWHDPNPAAALARRGIEELGGVDSTRLRQCQRAECDLLFFDPTRSRSRRWHAEQPCGWLERQHRRRAQG